MNKIPVVFCWSGGKDSALALYKIMQSTDYQVAYLLTTVNKEFSRISMHGIHEDVLRYQTECIGIPLRIVYVSSASNEEYENAMEKQLKIFKAEGINAVVFGDIFLEDLREYREKKLSKIDMQAIFPLWKQDTKNIANEFIALGFKTTICCVNDAVLNENFVGKDFTPEYVNSLPNNVDCCGENGEFHSFCYDGPLFTKPLAITIGEKCYKPLDVTNQHFTTTKGFWFCDITLNK